MERPSAAFIVATFLLFFLVACPVFAGPVEDSTKAYRSGDYKTAYQLIKPQAEKGDANAQFILGFLYDEGKGVPQDYTEAVKWYRRAAEQGNKAARHNLGLMGEQDQVARDRAEMQKWHQRAAEQGNKAAQHNLNLLDDQDQVWKDRAEMEKWHRRAAEPGNATDQSNPRLMDGQGDVPKDNNVMEKWHRRVAE
jgi:TPR repeat protein